MQRTRFWRFPALLVVAAMLFAACGSDDGGDGEVTSGSESGGGDVETYALAYVGPKTGDAANLGINILNGAKVAIAEFNEENEDIQVELKEFDTQGDPAQAPTVKDKYVNDEEILGIVGPAFSGETKAVLPSLEEEGLVMVSASATNKDLPTVVPNSKVFHRMLADDQAQAAGLAKYFTTKLKPKTLAIVHDNSEYGKGLAVDQLAPQLSGITVSVTEAIDPKSDDYSAAVNKVKAANPDAVFFGGYYEEAGKLKKQLVDEGVKATFVSGDGSLDPGFIEAAGAAGAEGAQLSCPCNLATEASEGELGAFAKAYKELNQVDSGTYSTEGYDAARLLLAGIKAGNTTREKLLDYVEGLTTVEDAISKEIEFAENGNIKAQGVFLFQVKGGKIVPLLATDDL
ncbi:MAG TPA: branched-chain amino acid ABC transporter substrate-binding protein [Acidimicrobiales bacterium]|nr:branched-chain amino acid ABC transporter substrate-binding protein [Acidimicrobiales bacterium]